MSARRGGFTLIEVVAALVLLSIIMSMMGALTFSAARQSVSNGTAAQRQAASMELVNRYATLPFTALTSYLDTVEFSGNQFERTAVVTAVPDSAIVLITTTPVRAGSQPVQVRLVRSRNATAQNPLCSPSC
jgi:prepilin-type N-terminal cleavage/methylation domain-containing protein